LDSSIIGSTSETPWWLNVWYYLFLADETHYEVWHLVVGGWFWQCLLLPGHVMNYEGGNDLYKKGDFVADSNQPSIHKKPVPVTTHDQNPHRFHNPNHSLCFVVIFS
jgi:hypothetical protein